MYILSSYCQSEVSLPHAYIFRHWMDRKGTNNESCFI